MNLMITRTSKMFNLLWGDIWVLIEDHYWQFLVVMFIVGMFTSLICIGGLTPGDTYLTMKPWVNNAFSIGAFMLMSSLFISTAIGCSYPFKWVRHKWRKSCELFPKPRVWDREDN